LTQSQIIKWTIKTPLLTNRHILRDMIIFYVAVCAVFFILMAGLAFVSDSMDVIGTYLLIWAVACGALFVLMLVAILGYFANSTEFTYELRKDGVLMSAGDKERKVNRFAVVIGLLTGNLKALGAGLLGASQEDYFVPWEDISRVGVHRGDRMLVLKAGLIPGNRIFCTAENFHAVENAFRENAKTANFVEK
jgi:hypothetical protein